MTRNPSVQLNGVANRIAAAPRSSERGEPPRATVATRSSAWGFTLADTVATTPRLKQKVPTVVLGVGSTAVDLVTRTGRLVKSALGFGPDSTELPGGYEHLLIETVPPAAGFDPARTFVVPGGVHGAATVAAEGRELFRRPATAAALRAMIVRCLSGLRSDDPRLPCGLAPAEAAEVVVVGGCGGTGGGGQDEVVTIVHEAAGRCRIRDLRVIVHLIGPEAAIHDVGRNLPPKQARTIRANACSLLTWSANDFASDGTRADERPDGTTERTQRSDRVWALTVADRSNGTVTCQTVDELLDVQSASLFYQIFTRAGSHLAEREIDFAGTREDGRGERRTS